MFSVDKDSDEVRQQLREHLFAPLAECPAVLALWEGGSIAFDRLDEHSDLDVCMLVDEDQADEVWAIVESTMRAWRPITHSFKTLNSIVAGAQQQLFVPQGVGPYFFVDVVLFMASSPVEKLMDRTRHGEPVVHWDHTGRIVPVAPRPETHAERLERAVESAPDSFEVYRRLVLKELARGRSVEAQGFYQGCLRQLLIVLGARYRPERFDFGVRYVHRDFPAEVVDQLERLAFPQPQQIPDCLEEMSTLLTSTRDAVLSG